MNDPTPPAGNPSIREPEYPWSHGLRNRDGLEDWSVGQWARSLFMLILGRARELPTRSATKESELYAGLGDCVYAYIATAYIGYSEGILICLPNRESIQLDSRDDHIRVSPFDTGGLIYGHIKRTSQGSSKTARDLIAEYSYEYKEYAAEFHDFIYLNYDHIREYVFNAIPSSTLPEISADNSFQAFVWEGRVPKNDFSRVIDIRHLIVSEAQRQDLLLRALDSTEISSDEFDDLAAWLVDRSIISSLGSSVDNWNTAVLKIEADLQ
ncbi:MAG: hypothetical protein AAF791_07825 [Bacteroidota bacterium]